MILTYDRKLGLVYVILGFIMYLLGMLVWSEVIGGEMEIGTNELFGAIITIIGLIMILFGANRCKIARFEDDISILEDRINALEDRTSPEYREPEDPKEYDALMGR